MSLVQDIERLLGPDSPAKSLFAHWEHRSSQLEMAVSIAKRIESGGSLLIEAPTGVGKTLAYLLPALLSGRRVVVSTNTKTLQDQIVDKDLPQLARLLSSLGLTIRQAQSDGPAHEHSTSSNVILYSVMKGRSNYLCLARLDRRLGQGSFDFLDESLRDLARWAKETQRGDRAELSFLPERSSLWDELDARSEICTGTRCPRHDECFVVRMREEAEQASLVVVNHHLLLADLSLKASQALKSRDQERIFGEVIPNADVLVIDEAHGLEDIASDYFGGQVSWRKLDHFFHDASATLVSSRHVEKAILRLTQARSAFDVFFRALPKRAGRVRISRDDSTLAEARLLLSPALLAIEGLLDSLESDVADDSQTDLIVRRGRDLVESFRFVVSADDPDYVFWMENESSPVLGAAPIVVSNLLSRFLFGRFESVILTSATLSTGDKECGFFRRSIGAPEECETKVLDSPFDLSRQAALYLPKDAPDPDAPAATMWLAKTSRQLIELVGGGAMFLFTSYRMMRALHAQLSAVLDYPVLLQGDRPKRLLLQEFVASAPAVLFATASFWEGVDIPGDPLRLVLIDRLPFDSPQEPLVSARSARIEAEGRSAFAFYQLPRAILRLKQGFGRLVRSRDDRGVVAILDGRIRRRGYGKRVLRALPETRVFEEIEAVRSWWSGSPHDQSDFPFTSDDEPKHR